VFFLQTKKAKTSPSQDNAFAVLQLYIFEKMQNMRKYFGFYFYHLSNVVKYYFTHFFKAALYADSALNQTAKFPYDTFVETP